MHTRIPGAVGTLFALDMTVKQYIDSVAKVVGAPIEITRYVRFETGEGMEKKDENFAEEVAKAMN